MTAYSLLAKVIEPVMPTIMEAAVTMVCTYGAVVLHKWEKMNTDNKLIKWMQIHVQAAEQNFIAQGLGPSKKQAVLDAFHKQFPNVDTNKVNALLESAVTALKTAQNQPTTVIVPPAALAPTVTVETAP